MMQASDSGQSNDLGLPRRSVLGGSRNRGITKLSVDSVGVVVVDIVAKQAMQVTFVHIEHRDYVYEEFLELPLSL